MCELNISPNIFNLFFLILKIFENITTIRECDGRSVFFIHLFSPLFRGYSGIKPYSNYSVRGLYEVVFFQIAIKFAKKLI